MPKITKEWVAGLDKIGLDKINALGGYNRQATLLYLQASEFRIAAFNPRATTKQRNDMLSGLFIPYYTLWISMLYVVHEGLTALDIEDKTLLKARAQVNMDLLRRFRNATFHFQPQFAFSSQHIDLIDEKTYTRAYGDTNML